MNLTKLNEYLEIPTLSAILAESYKAMVKHFKRDTMVLPTPMTFPIMSEHLSNVRCSESYLIGGFYKKFLSNRGEIYEN